MITERNVYDVNSRKRSTGFVGNRDGERVSRKISEATLSYVSRNFGNPRGRRSELMASALLGIFRCLDRAKTRHLEKVKSRQTLETSFFVSPPNKHINTVPLPSKNIDN